jgi:sugar O-acyltransferase (sialic acid O-acetyltransferase NeuD family)
MYLFGASGHCKVIIDIIKQNNFFEIKVIVDDDPKLDAIFGIEVIKSNDFKFNLDENLFISIGNNRIRKITTKKYKLKYPVLIHPKVIIGYGVTIDDGSVVMAGAIINPAVVIGKHCIINTAAIVEHDCFLEDFVHICPNATLAGNVLVGEGSQIGIGATVIQGKKIGKWATIGAGAVIINDVPDYAVVVGNPGKIIKYNNDNE